MLKKEGVFCLETRVIGHEPQKEKKSLNYILVLFLLAHCIEGKDGSLTVDCQFLLTTLHCHIKYRILGSLCQKAENHLFFN